jgi:HTH-type transcriptional regulator/antitoxin HigA
MTTDDQIWSDLAIPPGDTLAETIEALGMSQTELARRAGRPVQAINEIIQGRKEITPETALEFERVLGVPAHVWVRLEADYRITKARRADQETLRAEIDLAKGCPYVEMQKLGWVPAAAGMLDRVRELLRFFGVASLHHVEASAHWRKSKALTPSEFALAAWLRQGETAARRIDTATFDARRLVDALSSVRSFTRERAEDFHGPLTKLLADHGVALVLVPHLRQTGAHGATRWVGGKAVVQLSIRYRWADVFWFTLFHELGHVVRHGRKEVFINFPDHAKDEQEHEADDFASQHLIPHPLYRRFVAVRRPFFSTAAVSSFAAEVGVHPGIIVGRLQHDKHIPRSNLNRLRVRYQWAEEERA